MEKIIENFFFNARFKNLTDKDKETVVNQNMLSHEDYIKGAINAVKFFLNEAAENAFVSPIDGKNFEQEVNKKSITSVINKYL